MVKSTQGLQALLAELRREVHGVGLSDAEWAARAGLRAETLARLKAREDCDLSTLLRLAGAVGATLQVSWAHEQTDDASLPWPATFSREDEDRLVRFVASRSMEPRAWLAQGSAYFMAGVAVLLASLPGFSRRRYLELGERLHVGISTPEVFEAWLRHSPLEPSRFEPMLRAELEHAA